MLHAIDNVKCINCHENHKSQFNAENQKKGI